MNMKRLMEKLDALLELGGIKKNIVLLAISGAALVMSFINSRWPFLSLPFDLAWVAILLCGIPIVLEALIGLITRFDIKADVLVAMALIASVCIREEFAAGEVAFIMKLGERLEDLTVDRARSGIEKLVRLTPRVARVLTEDTERLIPAEQVKREDMVRVLPGETVPVDGVITQGETSVNQAIVTGEPIPVDKTVGDTVLGGTVNQFGAFTLRATRDGEDSTIRRMIRLVESADAEKAKIVSLADRWATWIVVAALTGAILAWVFTGEITRAVTVLVVFCPCALVLATPAAIMAAIGNAAKRGFLVREGDALERLSKVDTVTFDKTGTLTYGTPVVIKAETLSNYTEEEIYRLAAAAETLSEHPLGRAIVKGYGKALPQATDFRMVPGEGVTATVEGKRVRAGNEKLISEARISLDGAEGARAYLDRGWTVIYVAVEERLGGYIALSDTPREEAPEMLKGVAALGVTPVLLTGDGENAARYIADSLGIREVQASCLPEDKLTRIDDLQKSGHSVCMMGDGINDAPALKKADVGIAMGGVGSDIAVEAADIALVDDQIKGLPHLIALSRRMMTTIKVNIAFSMTLNFLAVGLAMAGRLGPVVGALVHNAGSVLVILNSALLLGWQKRTR